MNRHLTNDFQQGVKISIPKSTVRTISLDKLRAPSPLVQHQSNIPTNASKHKVVGETNKGYANILDRKLNLGNHKVEAKQKGSNIEKFIPAKKFQELKKEVEFNEMKECTFKPVVNPNEKDRRKIDQFFHDQINFNKRKEDKIEEMRMIIQANKEKQNVFRPNAMLNRQKKSVNGEDTNKVYERLYEDSKNKDKNSQLARQESSDTLRNNSITKNKRFKGISRGNSSQKINRVNNSKNIITNPSLVSQDIHKESQMEHQQSIDLSSITTRKTSIQLNNHKQSNRTHQTQSKESKGNRRVDLNIYEKKDNSKNQQIYIAKLMKQMTTIMEKCGLPLVLSYMEMNLFFQKMNFITKQATVNSRKHIYEIWNTLQGQIFQQVSVLSLMKIVYAIMGCHNVNLVNKCVNESWLSDQQAIVQYQKTLKLTGKQISFRQNILMLSERDSKTIKNTFDELYVNRLKLGESELMKNQKIDQYTFKPKISKVTAELAEKYRNRVISQSQKLIADNKLTFEVTGDGQLDHINMLMLDEKRKDAVLKIKREQHQYEKKKLEDQSMLNPLSERSSNRSSRNCPGNQKDRNQQLYEMGKQINQNKKDKSADEVEEQKWKKQLTFKPNLKQKNNILHALNSKDTFIHDYDKAVYRMHEGRKMRDHQKYEANDQKDTSPLLYLNVVMQGCPSVKVPVYAKDNMKSITEKVKRMMDLDKQSGNEKLQKILKMQILPTLKQMGLQNFMNQ